MRSIVLLLCLAAGLRADVRLPALISDHMVIQRDVPVRIWGRAAPAEALTVRFQSQQLSTRADDTGSWAVWLAPTRAGGPFDLSVSGTNTITIRDVLVGDVWVASGQSNMEWTVSNSADPEKEIAAANFPQIRLFKVP